jgi:hypothetical protein
LDLSDFRRRSLICVPRWRLAANDPYQNEVLSRRTSIWAGVRRHGRRCRILALVGPEKMTRRRLMYRRKMIGLLGGACTIALASGLTGCYGPAYYEEPAPPPYYDDYYYYPDVDVYFQIYTGWYYYKADGIWWRTKHLPTRYHLDPWYRRPLVMKANPAHRPPPPHREAFPPPPAHRPPASTRNREERQHNERMHEEYILRWKHK